MLFMYPYLHRAVYRPAGQAPDRAASRKWFWLAFGIILSFSRIAQRRIEKEQRDALPLIELKENVQAGLDDLDAFESGEPVEEEEGEELNDEMNEYGI